jgi:glycerol-3-phosphate dehydrogenase
MAEKASDLVCQEMGIDIPCSTHLNPLPRIHSRLGARDRLKKTDLSISAHRKETLCDCELVEREELENILSDGNLKDLQDILHRTRLAKGTCQGAFCVYRLLGVLNDLKKVKEDPNRILEGFLEERWKGIRPVLWGRSIAEQELVESIYKGIFNLTPTHPSPLNGEG